MKRMHEFLGPNVSDWNSRHTGTGAMTQDGTGAEKTTTLGTFGTVTYDDLVAKSAA